MVAVDSASEPKGGIQIRAPYLVHILYIYIYMYVEGGGVTIYIYIYMYPLSKAGT